ncbi:MAG: dTDP-4-dehydrorhamnose reductase [Hyphomicrobium sp.]
MTPPKIAVAGSTGQLALALQRAALRTGTRLEAIGRPRLDLTQSASVQKFLDDTSPGIVINAAAYTAVDKAESEPGLANAINAQGPGDLATACAARNIPLIHISTDYVFDGTKSSPYLEVDPVAPLGVYGRSKAEGEDAVRRLNLRHVIVRTSWIYGPDGSNFVKTMLRLASERDVIGVVADQHGAPTRADDLADALLGLATGLNNSPDENRWGTYHLAGRGETTWHGFAAEIFRHAAEAGLKAPQLNRITTSDYPTPARRPAYSVLDQCKAEAALGLKLPDWRDSLAAHFASLQSPAQLQPTRDPA